MSNKFRTVVFEIKNEEEFRKLWSELCDKMGSGDSFHGTTITGIAKSDVMTELEVLEERFGL